MMITYKSQPKNKNRPVCASCWLLIFSFGIAFCCGRCLDPFKTMEPTIISIIHFCLGFFRGEIWNTNVYKIVKTQYANNVPCGFISISPRMFRPHESRSRQTLKINHPSLNEAKKNHTHTHIRETFINKIYSERKTTLTTTQQSRQTPIKYYKTFSACSVCLNGDGFSAMRCLSLCATVKYAKKNRFQSNGDEFKLFAQVFR